MNWTGAILILVAVNVHTNKHYVDFQAVLLNQWSFMGASYIPPCSMIQFSRLAQIGSENTGDLNTCRFQPSLNTCFNLSLSSHDSLPECLSDSWHCIIPKFEVCSGRSICLSDECLCAETGTELFFCGDGQGCLTLNLVCDGKYDCLDRSDELLCDEVVNLTCSNSGLKIWRSDITISISRFIPCSNSWISSETYASLYPFTDCDLSFCNDIDIANSKIAGYEKFEDCLNILSLTSLEATDDLEKWLNLNLSSVCLDACKDSASKEVCQKIVSGKEVVTPGRNFEFRCPTNKINETQNDEQYLDMKSVCDGIFDCADKADELFCLDRLYCSKEDGNTSQVSWVSPEARCNSYKDCENGLDECDNCTDSSLSSDQFIVRNRAIFAWLIVSCLGNLILNVYLFWDNIKSEFSNQQNYVKVDRIMKLQICVYDGFLGVYLLAVVIANVRYWGKYCLFDDEWRSGLICQCLGMLFNFSSHGSLFSVLLMSLTRAYKCMFSYSRGIHPRKVVVLSILIATFNLAHSIIPAIPAEFIQNTFRIKLTMSQLNPFIMKDFDNISHVDRIYFQYFGKQETEVGLYKKLDELKKITNNPKFFSYRELSFYSWSPVCVQDLYGYRESLEGYKGCYIAFIITILITLSASYLKILAVFLESRRTVNPQGNEADSENIIILKVSFIIGIKLISWLTIIGAMTYYHLSRKNVPDGWFEATAICIVPVNSIVNPIFNSEILKHAENFFRDKFCEKRQQSPALIMIPPLQAAAEVIMNPQSLADAVLENADREITNSGNKEENGESNDEDLVTIPLELG
ncbi:hypothetical protein ACHWQZ_G001679 [Mnemiopsis leidyi]